MFPDYEIVETSSGRKWDCRLDKSPFAGPPIRMPTYNIIEFNIMCENQNTGRTFKTKVGLILGQSLIEGLERQIKEKVQQEEDAD